MKATRRKNGKMMVTRRVEFHLTLEDIAATLCAFNSAYDIESMTKREIERLIESELRNHGEDLLTREVDAIEASEIAMILKEKYPEFKGAK